MHVKIKHGGLVVKHRTVVPEVPGSILRSGKDFSMLMYWIAVVAFLIKCLASTNDKTLHKY